MKSGYEGKNRQHVTILRCKTRAGACAARTIAMIKWQTTQQIEKLGLKWNGKWNKNQRAEYNIASGDTQNVVGGAKQENHHPFNLLKTLHNSIWADHIWKLLVWGEWNVCVDIATMCTLFGLQIQTLSISLVYHVVDIGTFTSLRDMTSPNVTQRRTFNS